MKNKDSVPQASPRTDHAPCFNDALSGFRLESLSKIKSKISDLKEANWSPVTIYGYKRDYRAFCRWAEKVGVAPLPTSDDCLATYAAWLLDVGFRVGTVRRRISAVSHYNELAGLPSPIGDETKAVTKGAQRARKEQPLGKPAMTIDDLRLMCEYLVRCGDPKSLRNRALLSLGFAAGLRKSSLIALNVSDIAFAPQGMRVHLRYSKTDQEGKGRVIGVRPGQHETTCPIRAVADWIRARGSGPGPLFVGFASEFGGGLDPEGRRLQRVRMSTERLNKCSPQKILAWTAAAVGLDPKLYSPHSLRAGMVTTAAEAGASEFEIMRVTGHRTSAMVRRYVRHVQPFGQRDIFGGQL